MVLVQLYAYSVRRFVIQCAKRPHVCGVHAAAVVAPRLIIARRGNCASDWLDFRRPGVGVNR